MLCLVIEAMFPAIVRWDDVSSPFVDASGPVWPWWSVNLACPSFRLSLPFRLRVMSAGYGVGWCGCLCFALDVAPENRVLHWM